MNSNSLCKFAKLKKEKIRIDREAVAITLSIRDA